MDRYRLGFAALLVLCLTALCLGGQIPPSLVLGFLAGIPVPSPITALRRRDVVPALQPPVPELIPLPVPPPPELLLTEQQRLDQGWVIPEPSEPTQVGPPPLAAAPPRAASPGRELGAIVDATAKGTPESRRLNTERLVKEVQALKGVGLLLLLLLFGGCQGLYHRGPAPGPALTFAFGSVCLLLNGLLLYDLVRLLRGGRTSRRFLEGVLGVALLCIACTPAQRAAADRYGAALLACGAREAPAALQHGVSVALHAAAGSDWQGPLLQLGTQFGRCLVDAEVLRYALGDSGPQVRSQALALRQPGELGAGAAPQPDLAELARQRAVAWTTGGHR